MATRFAPFAAIARQSAARHAVRPGRIGVSTLRFYSSETPAADGSVGDQDVGTKLAELEAAKAAADKKVAELEEKVKEVQKDVLYHKAEIQTLNRRVSEERQKASEFAITSFARSLLGTADVLTTAMAHVPKPLEPGSALESFYNGVDLTQKAMFKTFAESGVVKMDVAKGTVFDPNLHEATFQVPKEVVGPKEGGGEWGPGEVVEVAKEGWMIGSRVLRPAQVGVTQIE